MKNKYVMINGLAFSEENDMDKLRNYAKEGWILEGIAGGFFYKLKEGTPQDIIYTLDYQSDTTEEYFTIFKEAGWTPVVSIKNQMHIFSAKAGTKPIYSDCESEMDKYIYVQNQSKKGTLYSSIIAVILMVLLVVSSMTIKPMFLILFGLLIIDIWVFIFNFMPYLAYSTRIKQMKKDTKYQCKTINNKVLYKINIFTGVIFLALGIIDLINKKYFLVFFIILGVYNIFYGIEYYKKYKSTL